MRQRLLSLISCLILSAPVYALSTDSEQPIYIDSDSQALDMISNTVTFIGDVVLKQGSINITADKVVVVRNSEDESIEQIEAFGKPSVFTQLTDDGKTLHGEANTLHYHVRDDLLTMTKNAVLSQDDSIIKGPLIKYLITPQKLIADGKKGERVSTVLQPTQPKKQ
ncbi:lipopolysaccharide transport periplasmic protein LptA [Vibrio nigripulchritudo]|uniref:lipopolysaccharide transport periplasmic protein LptA n=1 Tax=Vibrio nigripulchritudo TaxID=28173 RepID=UPI00190ADBC4|nr:lipopolysaccharide transport periplasmic protein LptA [Vibrio nigripulchritudo]